MKIEIDTSFSSNVKSALKQQMKSKRWLYLKMNMTPITLDSRLKNNDWRLDEIVKITKLLELK